MKLKGRVTMIVRKKVKDGCKKIPFLSEARVVAFP
jgi:hypothetical protein